MTTLSAFLIGCSLSLALGHSAIGKENDEDTDESESEVTIEKTVLARLVEDKFEPVKSFKPSDTFAVLVFLSEPKIGTKLKAVWTLVDAGGEQDKKILETKAEITPKAIKGVEEPNRINFSLKPNEPFPTGDYQVEIYLNEELAKTVKFKIK
jgi:DNA topoisomerase IA